MSRRRWAAAIAGVGCVVAGLIVAAVVVFVVFLGWLGLTVLTGIGQSAAGYFAAMKVIADAAFGPAAWVVPELARWLATLGDWIGVIRP